MKEKGYYDLLLKLNDSIIEDYIVSNINTEKINDIDFYLLKQLNYILKEKISTQKTITEKINFINQFILNNNSTLQLSENILLKVKDNINQSTPLFNSTIRLIDNYLFTNENEQELITHFNNELLSADTVYLIYPFISRSFLNKIKNSLDICYQNNIKINIITTTFDGKAYFCDLEALKDLILNYKNITIKVEDIFSNFYERIHIKAAIFHRNSQFSTAIIGSSNLTISGMSLGKEWNIKISQFNNDILYQNILEQFKRLWSSSLINFNDEEIRSKLLERLKEYQNIDNNFKKNSILKPIYELFSFQKDIIQKLIVRRKTKQNKNLIIMATGTGKTIISAFDYKKQKEENNNIAPSLLFIAHQKEIIDQSIKTFRNVLQDEKFGNVFYQGVALKKDSKHLFATIQSIVKNKEKFNSSYFDIIIFDEAHHIAAKTFLEVFHYFKSKQILGLTATPEREDGKLISSYFDNNYAYELRLWDAIQQSLLVPFDYYCIDDISSDLTNIDINNDTEVFKKLNTDSRNELLYKIIYKYIGINNDCHTLIFCITMNHAKIVANFLKTKNLKASYLTSEVNKNRQQIIKDFKKGKINYLCVVNMFNEGIDIPEINKIILLRPTNSKTIYLQQLGRGLRKSSNKVKLEVYDLIANIDNKYDIALGIRNLYSSNLTNIQSIIEGKGLPNGCTITLEKRSQELIIKNLKKWYESKRRIYLVVQNYYSEFKNKGLEKILIDYDLTIYQFYNNLNDFYLKVGQKIKIFTAKENDWNRNKNILKQFIFLNDYNIINYFLKRLKNKINKLNYHYDNLLVCSILYEVTSKQSWAKVCGDYENINDLVSEFIKCNILIVDELILLLEYKLNNESLIVNEKHFYEYPLLNKHITFTVRQALCAINKTNFIKNLGALHIIAFQAGHLTFENNTKSVIFADMDGKKYGNWLEEKFTRYEKDNKKFYWSLPTGKTYNSKMVSDLQNPKITKFLFLKNDINKELPNLFLKFYDFIAIGEYHDIIDINENNLGIIFTTNDI